MTTDKQSRVSTTVAALFQGVTLSPDAPPIAHCPTIFYDCVPHPWYKPLTDYCWAYCHYDTNVFADAIRQSCIDLYGSTPSYAKKAIIKELWYSHPAHMAKRFAIQFKWNIDASRIVYK